MKIITSIVLIKSCNILIVLLKIKCFFNFCDNKNLTAIYLYFYFSFLFITIKITNIGIKNKITRGRRESTNAKVSNYTVSTMEGEEEENKHDNMKIVKDENDEKTERCNL